MKKVKQYKPKKFKGKTFKRKNKERSERQALYQDPRWKKFRMKFLAKNKHCYACGEDKYQIQLDHIVAHKGDTDKFFDTHNVIPLCIYCHSEVTGKFDRGTVINIEGKAEWITKMRKERGLTFPVKFVGEI